MKYATDRPYVAGIAARLALCPALARNISKILSGGVSYVLRLIFVAYLFKRWNDLFQSERDFSLVVEIQICRWPVHGPSKHSQSKLNPP